jgi:hypothetical protein
VGVVHQRQGLALGLEAGRHLFAVHIALDDLHGDLATHGRGLLGKPNLAHTALAQLLQQPIRTDRTWRIGIGVERGSSRRQFGERFRLGTVFLRSVAGSRPASRRRCDATYSMQVAVRPWRGVGAWLLVFPGVLTYRPVPERRV